MVLETIRAILAEQFEVEAEQLMPETDIIADLGADSLDLVELIMQLEEEYGISVSDEGVYQYTTVGAIAEFIESQL